MTPSGPQKTDDESARATAVQWTIRRDRGLSATEAIEFELWLAADPRHGEAMRQIDGAWTLLERTPEAYAIRELALLRQRRRRRRFMAGLLLPAAAALVLGSILWWQGRVPQAPVEPVSVTPGPQLLALADGSLVKLNSNAELTEDFDAAERRVHLRRGEAHFAVKKDATRPFIVVVGNVRLRAVGTAFNVNWSSSQVEVLVTEGRVRVDTQVAADASETMLEAGERAIVPAPASSRDHTSAASIVVERLNAAQMNRILAWQESLLKLGGASLEELASYFERHFGQRMILEDPEIGKLRAGGRIRGDHPEVFVNLLASTFDLEFEQKSDGAWILRKKNPTSR